MNALALSNNCTPWTVTEGRAYPLGASVNQHGVNFAIFSAHAEKVELCLFDQTGKLEIDRIELPEFTDNIWHGLVHDLPVGTLYGYRVYGPFSPEAGHRFNANKLLIDPYAKNLTGSIEPHHSHLAYQTNSNEQDLSFDQQDNAQYVPKCIVCDEQGSVNSHPQTRRRDSVIYEMHVKGFSQLNPSIPVELRGSYAGLSHPSVGKYLADLGITAVELLPVQSFVDEPFIQEKGLSNYWGYNSINFFVPDFRYTINNNIDEFKAMVDSFHQSGIEVILDVVYNHTAEGNELGPTYSFKGIDNASYYKLQNNKRYYQNDSGCGNTLNLQHPRVLQLVCDSLRYWVEKMGVDGFRFDLAPVLARNSQNFNRESAFFSALKQDPVLAKVKLIAEPWDIGNNGYQLGQFPHDWLEWNDKFRDVVRKFWRSDEGLTPEFAQRLHGSSDIFEQPSRRPSASVNFITSHDGFTLNDLVSYQQQHNHANGENNQDGHHSNFSDNGGIEGVTEKPTVLAQRAKQKRNLLTTLFIAQGTPMLLAGDELGNSQHGNNNAYCQDNNIAWLQWDNATNQEEMSFVKKLIALRKAHPLLNRAYYSHGDRVSSKTGIADISWYSCQGSLMTEQNWHNKSLKCFSMLLGNTDEQQASEQSSEHHESNTRNDDALLVIFNAHRHTINFQLPPLYGKWEILINTNQQQTPSEIITQLSKLGDVEKSCELAPQSCVVLSFTSVETLNRTSGITTKNCQTLSDGKNNTQSSTKLKKAIEIKPHGKESNQ